VKDTGIGITPESGEGFREFFPGCKQLDEQDIWNGFGVAPGKEFCEAARREDVGGE